MSRYPPIPPSDLTPEQNAIHEQITSKYKSLFGPSPPYEYLNSEGALIGPYPLLLHASWLGSGIFDHAQLISAHPALSRRVKELAVLAVGAHYKAPYEIYAHGRVAMAAAGLTESQVQAAAAGRVPEGLEAADVAAYRYAQALLNSRAAVPEEDWRNAVEALGKEGITVLTTLVGVYAYISLVLNAAAVTAPQQQPALPEATGESNSQIAS